MAKNDLMKLILSEIQEVKRELKEVRQMDIPNMREEMAVVKERSNNTAKIIAGAGSLIAIVVSSAIAKFLK